MNWRQLYISSTREERDDLSVFFKYIEARNNKWIFARGWLGLERRRAQAAHFVRERRGQPIKRPVLAAFLFIICTMSVTSWVIALSAEPELGATVLGMHLLFLYLILIWKPYRNFTS